MPKGVFARKTIEERFWAKVNKTDGCWEWTSSKDLSGYGQLWGSNKVIVAHRWAYEQLVGRIPDGLTLDHLCRNRACVNPAHLEPVTMKENVLRGEGPTAKNAHITHCPKGHPYDLLNTYFDPRGWRGCRACEKARNRGPAGHHRKREEPRAQLARDLSRVLS